MVPVNGKTDNEKQTQSVAKSVVRMLITHK